MPRLADPNGIAWDVQPVGEAFTAKVATDSANTYINQGESKDDVELPGKAFLSWPQNGEPVINGQVKGAAKSVIDGFATTAKGTMAARVREKSPPVQTPAPVESSLVPFLALVAFVYYADR